MSDFSSLWLDLDESIIVKLDKECDKLSGEPDGEWYDEVLSHVAKTGGKRVRPKFLLVLLKLLFVEKSFLRTKKSHDLQIDLRIMVQI